MDLGNFESLHYFAPELVLSGAILALVLLDLVLQQRKGVIGDLALIVAGAAIALIGYQSGLPHAWLFNRMLVFDSFAIFFRALIGLATVIAIWMSLGSVEVRSGDQGEYYAILLSSALAMLLMAESANLLTAY